MGHLMPISTQLQVGLPPSRQAKHKTKTQTFKEIHNNKLQQFQRPKPGCLLKIEQGDLAEIWESGGASQRKWLQRENPKDREDR